MGGPIHLSALWIDQKEVVGICKMTHPPVHLIICRAPIAVEVKQQCACSVLSLAGMENILTIHTIVVKDAYIVWTTGCE